MTFVIIPNPGDGVHPERSKKFDRALQGLSQVAWRFDWMNVWGALLAFPGSFVNARASWLVRW